MAITELREQRAALVRAALRAANAAEAAEGSLGAQKAHEAYMEAERAVMAHDERVARAEAIEHGGIDARVGAEAPTYSPDHQGFFSDLYRAKNGDTQARARLERNNLVTRDELTLREKTVQGTRERTDIRKQLRAISQTMGAMGEFIPPTYLNLQWVTLLRAGRPFADQCLDQPLVDGTNQINIPKITGGASTAVQTDGGAVSNTDQTTELITAQYQTIAGRTIGSRQEFDFGVPSQDLVIFTDLAADYARTLDDAVLNGTVTNAKGVLQLSGTNVVTYTDAAPTGPKLYAPVFQARSAIAKKAFMPPDFMAMHPSTWNWFISSLDSNNRPLALDTSSAAYNAMSQFNPAAQGPSGNIAGIPVIEDANFPVNLGAGTDQAPVLMVNRSTLFLYENAPVMRLADQVSIGNLQIQYVMWGYYAVLFGRHPEAISVINGTGTIVQSGF